MPRRASGGKGRGGGVRDFETVVVGSDGVARVADLRPQHEAARIAAVKARGAVPREVGPDVVEAPARGAFRVVDQRRMVRTQSGGLQRVHDGFEGRRTIWIGDGFDKIEGAARAAHSRAVARARDGCACDAPGECDCLPVYVPPFTSAQVEMGRHYYTIWERHKNAGVRCSSVEGLSGGSGDGGGFIDAVLSDRAALEVMRARIGHAAAREVRRHRPSKRGSRRTITDRRLVDMVCLEEATLSDVLMAHGWSVCGQHVKDLQSALAGALDRMMGPVRGRRTAAVAYGEGCAPLFG